VIPEKNLVVSIKFTDSKCDNNLFKKWIKNVVRLRLDIPGYNSRSSTESSVRVRFSTPSSPEDYGYLYRFETAIREFDTSLEYLEAIAADTKTITVRDYVTTYSNVEGVPKGAGVFDFANADVLQALSQIIKLLKGSE